MLNSFFLLTASLLLLTVTSTIAVDYDHSEKINFLIIGDQGKDNDGQLKVAEAMKQFCTLENCDYGILAGDNVYQEGVESPTDMVLERKFDKYYNQLNIPFLVALGNHDYGKLSNDWKRGGYQLLHGERNPLFYIPHYYYIKETEHAVIAVLDTTRLMWAKSVKQQIKMIKKAQMMAKESNKWFFVLGHHPYLSNGKHGNAGRYERLPAPYFVSGTFVRWFLDRYVCGKADFYLAGHDHSLQVFDGNVEGCNTQLVVSGTGASATKLYKRNKYEFQSLDLGFFHLQVGEESVGLRAYNHENTLLFEKNYIKPSRTQLAEL